MYRSWRDHRLAQTGKVHLAHGQLGYCGQAYFSTFENLFGDSLTSEPIFKTTKEAKKAAEILGFKKVSETVHGGQAVCKRGKDYITRDLDDHNGGAWKMAGFVKALGSREARAGIFDINLKRIGD